MVINLILMNFPFVDGGGEDSTIGSITSFNFDVGIFFILFWKTFTADSKTSNIRCFSLTEVKIIGTSVNGAILSKMPVKILIIHVLFKHS